MSNKVKNQFFTYVKRKIYDKKKLIEIVNFNTFQCKPSCQKISLENHKFFLSKILIPAVDSSIVIFVPCKRASPLFALFPPTFFPRLTNFPRDPGALRLWNRVRSSTIFSRYLHHVNACSFVFLWSCVARCVCVSQ